jgi:hypothetical protein
MVDTVRQSGQFCAPQTRSLIARVHASRGSLPWLPVIVAKSDLAVISRRAVQARLGLGLRCPPGYEKFPDYGGPEPTRGRIVFALIAIAVVIVLVVWRRR